MIAAVVPAAGASTRMGRPKLTLPLAGGDTAIARVVNALRHGGVEAVVVIGPPLDAPGAAELLDEATRAGASAIPAPGPTAEMRATFELGLDVLQRSRIDFEVLLVAPGDAVGLTPAVVDAVIARHHERPEALIVPIHEGRRGHPLALPPDLARAVRDLPDGLGLNALRDRYPDRLDLLEVPEAGVAEDLDTPDDYLRWAPSEP